MSAPQLILYDIARRGGNACWSYNVWKIRLALNYKGIPYRTQWLSHPEIASFCSGLGLKSHPPGSGPLYTLPVVRLPSGECIMDSAAIAAKLEEVYPDRPSLRLDPELLEQIGGYLQPIGRALAPVFMPIVARNLIVEEAVPWFRQSRERAFGMSLDDFEAVRGGEKAYQAAGAVVKELVQFVVGKQTAEGGGPFVLGQKASYADFMLVALMEGMKRIDQQLFDRLFKVEKDLMRLYDATAEWREKDT